MKYIRYCVLSALIGITLIGYSIHQYRQANKMLYGDTEQFNDKVFHSTNDASGYFFLASVLFLAPLGLVIFAALGSFGGSGNSHYGEVQINGKDNYGRPVDVWIKVKK